jgi:tetraacyldisaccharide 4'-kinase
VKRPSRLIESAALPLAGLYGSVMSARNLAFDRGLLKAKSVGCPVISIGNITAGGTGKTPLTSLLIEGFQKRGLRVGLVSRGYGGSEKGPVRVATDGANESAKRFGDEPTWFAQRFPEVPVVICGDRVAAARSLLAADKVDLILADDAFQHRYLHRDLDIVVLDPTEPAWHYRPLPLGREREGFDSLSRAQAIFVTKTNLAEEARVNWLNKKIAHAVKEKRTPVYELEAHIPFFLRVGSSGAESSRASASFRGERVLLVSGIGRPHTFARLIRNFVRAEVMEHLVFADHHAYSAANLADIESRAVKLGVSAILVTEKDAVKMSAWNPSVPCWASRLETRPKSDLGSFYEAVDRLLR